MFTDETTIRLSGPTMKRVIRKSGEGLEKRHIIQTVKFGGGGLMVWGCIGGEGKVGKLKIINGTMDGKCYRNVIRKEVKESKTMLFGKSRFIFQQDNAPIHTAKKQRNFSTAGTSKL